MSVLGDCLRLVSSALALHKVPFSIHTLIYPELLHPWPLWVDVIVVLGKLRGADIALKKMRSVSLAV